MSAKLMSRIFEEARGLTSGERVVLLAIAEHANEAGECWPSTERLAARCELKERTIRRNLRSLEAAGYLTTTWNGAPGQRRDRATNLFRIRFPAPQREDAHVPSCDAESEPTGGRPRPNGGTPTSATGGRPRPNGGTPTSPRTVIEPNTEPNTEPPAEREDTDDPPLFEPEGDGEKFAIWFHSISRHPDPLDDVRADRGKWAKKWVAGSKLVLRRADKPTIRAAVEWVFGGGDDWLRDRIATPLDLNKVWDDVESRYTAHRRKGSSPPAATSGPAAHWAVIVDAFRTSATTDDPAAAFTTAIADLPEPIQELARQARRKLRTSSEDDARIAFFAAHKNTTTGVPA